MAAFLFKRILYMIPTLLIISVISFVIIQLPPGDYMSTYIAALEQSGSSVDAAMVENLRRQYGLNQPLYVQYYLWMKGIVLRGDFGYSLEWNRPVADLIKERITLTMVVSVSSLLFAWMVALPIGVFSAVRQYSIPDYVFTFFGFLGLAVPNFLLALVLMYVANRYLGVSIGGLFSREYIDQAWSFGKFVDLLKHLWIPMIIIGTSGIAGLIRIMRANLLDELRKPYVETGTAKGLRTWHVIIKYPTRVALNPFISTVGFIFPQIISGERGYSLHSSTYYR